MLTAFAYKASAAGRAESVRLAGFEIGGSVKTEC
jgi:hypothetical protein